MIDSNSFQKSLNTINDCLVSQNPYIRDKIMLAINGIINMPIELFDFEKIYKQLIARYTVSFCTTNFNYIIDHYSSTDPAYTIFFMDKSEKVSIYIIYNDKYLILGKILQNKEFKIAKEDIPILIEKLKTIKTMVNFI